MTKFFDPRDWEPMPDDEGALEEERRYWDREGDQFLHDGEADADALASAGWGTDEDYGGFDGGEW